MADARPTPSGSAPRPPSTRRSCSTSATTSGSSSRPAGHRRRRRRSPPSRTPGPANAEPAGRRRRPQLATFNVLNYFTTTGEEFVRQRPGRRHAARTSTTATATRSRTTRATPTVRAAPANTDEPRSASRPRSSPRSTASTRHRLARGARELGEVRQGPRLRDHPARDGAQRRRRRGHLGRSRPRRPRPTGRRSRSEDVIRTGFIYKPADVELVGGSRILVDEDELRQRPRAAGPGLQAPPARRTPTRSRSSSTTSSPRAPASTTAPAQGQRRTRTGSVRPTALADVRRATSPTDRGIEAVFLAGDFNSYIEEDPMQVLYDARATRPSSPTPRARRATPSADSPARSTTSSATPPPWTWSPAPTSGTSTRAESVAYQYSRYNYNVTQFFDGTVPFAASDHNPEIVGHRPGRRPAGTVDVQILGTNDFHGRLDQRRQRRGRSGRAGRCGQAAARAATRTRSSPPRVT